MCDCVSVQKQRVRVCVCVCVIDPVSQQRNEGISDIVLALNGSLARLRWMDARHDCLHDEHVP